MLRSGAAEKTFRGLAEHGLLEAVTPELIPGARDGRLGEALTALDRYRGTFEAAPATLTNSILLGTLIIPLGLMPRRAAMTAAAEETDDDETRLARGARVRRPAKEPPLKIGILMVARRDTDRLRQLMALQRRLTDLESSPRAKRALMHRGPFEEALTWLNVHGHAPEIVEHWKGFLEAATSASETPGETADAAPPGPRRRGRRRRRRRRKTE